MPIQKTREELATEPITPTGLICPKDPDRASTDPKRPPTHLALDVLEVRVDQSPQLTREQLVAGVKRKPTEAEVECRTCGHKWTVKPWPPRP